ncbi:MAG TPA: hypothetical protein VGO77_16415 [Mycobacterium sp.]|jgi:hypothetical protein|uniref:hypothetical protein n=1 Tax=Mycobacterium sp. TaxID=1785 RepID=UPI0028BCF8CF|nr:hypothetical protein [Mycobacterium sp.]MDT5118623.1 hypothetical protein [Mycobacterium sp.]HEV7581967.1 hypothetical protein [Mycobacterium sp.]
MLTWETLDAKATHPRYRAVSGKHEFRVFYDPASSGSQDRPWILVVREVGEDGVHTHAFHETYSAAADAKEAAEQWKGPPLK